jgi:hypothetical protein
MRKSPPNVASSAAADDDQQSHRCQEIAARARRSGSLRPRPGATLAPAPQTSHDIDALAAAQRDRCRTAWATARRVGALPHVDARGLLLDAWSSTAGFGVVATALVLAASRPSASAQSNDRPCSSAMRRVRACGDQEVSHPSRRPALRLCCRGYGGAVSYDRGVRIAPVTANNVRTPHVRRGWPVGRGDWLRPGAAAGVWWRIPSETRLRRSGRRRHAFPWARASRDCCAPGGALGSPSLRLSLPCCCMLEAG